MWDSHIDLAVRRSPFGTTSVVGFIHCTLPCWCNTAIARWGAGGSNLPKSTRNWGGRSGIRTHDLTGHACYRLVHTSPYRSIPCRRIRSGHQQTWVFRRTLGCAEILVIFSPAPVKSGSKTVAWCCAATTSLLAPHLASLRVMDAILSVLYQLVWGIGVWRSLHQC